jgi:hypothetical protein
MFGKWKAPCGAIVLVCLFGAVAANASTINFFSALALGNLPESVIVNGITVSSWDVSKTMSTQWSSNVILNNRSQGPDDRGLGVCTNRLNCPTIDNGNINEIDNNGSTFEVIRLDFGAITAVATIGLSSLDSGPKDGFAIFGSNVALPDLSMLTPLAQGTNQSLNQVDPNITINQSFRYFFVTPKERGPNSANSDFLLASVSTPLITTSAPEPTTYATIGIGILALVSLSRMTTRRRNNS